MNNNKSDLNPSDLNKSDFNSGENWQDNVSFLLVRPQFLGNIGSIARVMKNFGFVNLRFVKAPKEYKDSEARKMAVDAIDVLKKALLFDTMDDALSDIGVSVGTTSCQQRQLHPVPFCEAAPGLRQLAMANQDGKVNKIAIVFGDERDGLSNQELARCSHIVTIPTNPAFPALNLAQAAAICAYELSKKNSAEVNPEAVALTGTADKIKMPVQGEPLATGADNDVLFKHLADILDRAGFTRTYNHERVLSEIRSFYQRANPTIRETDLLRGALLKIAGEIKSPSQLRPVSKTKPGKPTGGDDA